MLLHLAAEFDLQRDVGPWLAEQGWAAALGNAAAGGAEESPGISPFPPSSPPLPSAPRVMAAALGCPRPGQGEPSLAEGGSARGSVQPGVGGGDNLGGFRALFTPPKLFCTSQRVSSSSTLFRFLKKYIFFYYYARFSHPPTLSEERTPRRLPPAKNK